MTVITKAQRHAIKRLWQRETNDPVRVTYRHLRKTAFVAFGDCLMVPWCGMIIGIETDGYTHS